MAMWGMTLSTVISVYHTLCTAHNCTVDDKDLAVTSDQGNALLFIYQKVSLYTIVMKNIGLYLAVSLNWYLKKKEKLLSIQPLKVPCPIS